MANNQAGGNRVRGREGFTLLEILVALIILAVLAAAVFPVVTQQTGSADPVRAATDLSSLKTAVQQFRLDLRPEFPGDVEDLVYAPSGTTEESVAGTVYGATLAGEWNGPYLDSGIIENTADPHTTGSAFATGFSGEVQNTLVCYDKVANEDDAEACVNGTHAVAAPITGLILSQFNAIDELIDGTESGGELTGNFRWLTATSTAYYFLSPYH